MGKVTHKFKSHTPSAKDYIKEWWFPTNKEAYDKYASLYTDDFIGWIWEDEQGVHATSYSESGVHELVLHRWEGMEKDVHVEYVHEWEGKRYTGSDINELYRKMSEVHERMDDAPENVTRKWLEEEAGDIVMDDYSDPTYASGWLPFKGTGPESWFHIKVVSEL